MIKMDLPVREGSPAVLEILLLEKECEWKSYGPRPFVIICPGGGFAMCGDRDSEPVALEYAGAWYHTGVLRYTIRQDIQNDPPVGDEPFRDLFAAIRLVRAHAQEWGVDPGKIIVEGDSAGGHVAAVAAALWPDTDRFPEAGEEAKPNAVVLGYPVITAEKNHGHLWSIANLTGTDDYGEEDIIRYSAEKHVGPHTCPAFLWHSVNDETVPSENSLLFAQACRKHHVPFELHLFSTGWHGLGLGNAEVGGAEPHAANWFPLQLSWLRTVGMAPEEWDAEH